MPKEANIDFQRRLAARHDCAGIGDLKQQKMCKALKLFRKYEKDMQKIGAEFQNNLELMNLDGVPLVKKFFAGDSPLIVLLSTLGEIAKLTPEGNENVGIESILRPEYEKIEKLSSQINAKKLELARTENDYKTKFETYNNNHKSMKQLLQNHRELSGQQRDLKSKFQDLRYVYDELEVLNNTIIQAVVRGEEIHDRLMKVDSIVEELLSIENEINSLQIKIAEKSDIIEHELENLILEEEQ